jgi:hypothetical protein
MAMLELVGNGKLMLIAVTLALALSTAGCATGPLGSHGVADIPAFDTAPPNQ